ncbi:MAG TPA: ATP-binding protein [Anaeromyxobacteraceae bacterium]
MDPVALELRLPPEWAAILATWDTCQVALRDAGLAEGEIEPLCMVARELLENAVKYGSYGPGDTVELTVRVGAAVVTVEVRNPVGGGPDQVRRVREALRSLRDGDDPLHHYVERMRALAREPAGLSGGLGLARIAWEGRGLLDFRLDGDNKLAVSAVYSRETRS